MVPKTIKVFEMRQSPNNIWEELCKIWSGEQNFIKYIVEVNPESPLSIWLVENGANDLETVILDMSL